MPSDMEDLNDNAVKLVAYSIVSVRRGAERILDGGEGSIIVTSRMTGETFTADIIGRYLQQKDADGKPRRIPEEDRKYLRVHYVVSNRWPREPSKFEEKEVEVLEEIARAIAGSGGDAAPAT